jgi:PAS domain S-box-containing protein
MRGWGWQSVHDPQVLPQVLARWAHSLASGEAFEMTFPLLGKDGRFRPFFTRVEPLKDASGRVTHWFGTNTDVSALHAAEQQLRQAEERLRLATHAGNIGIWDWDIQHNRVTWSEQVYTLHGLVPGQFGGRAEDFAALLHPQDRDAVWAKIDEAVRVREDFSADFRVVLPDGGERWLTTWARVCDDPGGEAGRMIGATISIDAYKKAEAALRDSDRRKDEFLAMLGHELRNPLAAISAAARLLHSQQGLLPQVHQASDVIAPWLSQLTVMLPSVLIVPGELTLSVTVRGKKSNSATVRVE